jgi:hypothetical protein
MTGPMEALERCRRAWEASQPQLPLELYPDDDGLEGGPARVPRPSLEPAAHLVASPGGGLKAGAEPRRGPALELTAPRTHPAGFGSAAAPAARTAGSAPHPPQTPRAAPPL